MDLTVQEAVNLHRQLWENIYNLIKRQLFRKDIVNLDYLRYIAISKITDERVQNACFLCEFSEDCSYCPMMTLSIETESSNCYEHCLDGLFSKFVHFYNKYRRCSFIIYRIRLKKKVLSLAKEIAELPVINPRYSDLCM